MMCGRTLQPHKNARRPNPPGSIRTAALGVQAQEQARFLCRVESRLALAENAPRA